MLLGKTNKLSFVCFSVLCFWDMGFGQQCGVLILPENSKSEAEFVKISRRFHGLTRFVQLLTNNTLQDVSGIELKSNLGLFFPTLGWLPPSIVCDDLLKSANISVIKGDVCKFHRDSSEGLWNLFDDNDHLLAQADILVMANANGISEFEETQFLDVKSLRGQVTELPSSESSEKIKTVICGEGYITPSQAGSHSCGATYNHKIITTDLRLNEPRYASLPNIMKAKKKELDVQPIDAMDLDTAPRMELLSVELPAARQEGIKVESVEELVGKLKNEAKVIS